MNHKQELKHYGVLGMKWGIRRTPQQLARARSSRMSSDASEVARIKKKKVYEMSNEELRKVNNRRQLEQNYSRLNPSTIKKGALIIGGTVAAMNTALNLYNNSEKLMKTGKKVISKFK